MNYAEMMKKKNNYAIILFASTIVIGLLITGFAVYPLYKSAANTTKQANQKTSELNELKSRKKILDGLKDKEAELKVNADLVSSALPNGNDVGGLFIQVNALATQNGGEVRSITGSASGTAVPTGFTGIQKYTYNVPVSFDNYFSLKSFIQSSKTALRLLNIDDVSVSAQETGSMDVVMNITTYARN